MVRDEPTGRTEPRVSQGDRICTVSGWHWGAMSDSKQKSNRVRFAHRRLPWHRAEGSRWHQSRWETMVAWREVVVAKMERVEKNHYF